MLDRKAVPLGVTMTRKVCRKQSLLNIAVPFPVSLVAEVAVAKRAGEEGNNAVLRLAFRVTDDGHVNTSQWPPLDGPTCCITPLDIIFSR